MLNSRFSHPDAVVSSMEAIMTMVIEESEEISFDLLGPLLASVKKENQVITFAYHLLHPIFFLQIRSYISFVHFFRLFHPFRGNWGRKL